MTAAKANAIRADRMAGKELSNTEQRAERQAAIDAEQKRVTVWQLWKQYAEHMQGRSTAKADTSRIKYLAPLHSKEPSCITAADISDLTDRLAVTTSGRGTPLSAQTQKHILALLRRLFVYANEKDLCPVPSLKFKMPTVDNERTEHMTGDQTARYIRALNEDKDQVGANLLRFIMVTGIRKGAVLALEWKDVDLERGFITLQGMSAKSGRTETLPLSAEAVRILQHTKRTESPYVFPSPRTGGKREDIRKLADRIKRNAGLPQDFRPVHGLRHHFGSTLVSSGQSLYTVQKLLPHSSPEMTKRYAHIADEALRRALESAPKATSIGVEYE